MRLTHFLLIPLLALAGLSVISPAAAQSEVAADPIDTLRDVRPGDFALVHADVVTEPGVMLSDATVLVQGTTITSVGRNLTIPPGYLVIDCQGKRIYPGLIDAWSEVDVPNHDAKSGYWNQNVTPLRNASQSALALPDAAKLRGQGITTRLVAPAGGIIKGSSAVVLLDGQSAGRALLSSAGLQHAQLTVPRGTARDRYPNSPMGATALARQALHDAKWYREAWDAYHANPRLPRPETNLALETLAQAVLHDTFVFDAQNERMAIRADHLASEFSVKAILRGSGREYRDLSAIAATRRPILVPVDFPEAPPVKSVQSLERVTLQDLMHWDLAPENPSRLAGAGVLFCLTTDGLGDVGQYLKQVRKAVERGLSPEIALAAMTTTPAKLLGIDKQVGRIEVGKLANLAITDGDLFDNKTKVIECWVAGRRFEISSPPKLALAGDMLGDWTIEFPIDGAPVTLQLVFSEKNDKLEGVVKRESASSKLKDLVSERDRVAATLNLGELDASLPQGVTFLTLIAVKGATPEENPDLFASLTLPSGTSVPLKLTRPAPQPAHAEAKETPAPDPSEESDRDEESSKEDQSEGTETESKEADQGEVKLVQEVATPLLSPLGAYGLESPIREQPYVLFRGATLWTCDEAGVLEAADLLIRDGLIVAIGKQLDAPEGCQVIDLRGKHISPGLIDCHSHMATDGGINESAQAVTSEVRVGDFIDNSDITIYRQLAGGLTTSNILHGSANPIGGQNQVIKLRWGQSMDGLRMKEAPAGIKFALGENVKRNQSRYPNTRMGVEQIIRDQLLAAREYHSKWRRWRAGERDMLPPRFDLQLEALSEVQQGTRWIHCHSYRQDEIVATLEVLEEFGIQIGTLQHILEGYKVADRMAQHGAMGSSFSDWWAYKFEVFDAIPYNGALMHDRGVVVSFNSDDRELARHMNTEAAKATKYGGVPEEEALKFVTLNPAKQLRIEQYVGSLTPGKHADLVIWSGRPLSTLTRCEQVWIDGMRYFDLQTDAEMRTRDADLRARLIQKALGAPVSAPSTGEAKPVAEEDRWVRVDVYCTTHGGLNHDLINSGEEQ